MLNNGASTTFTYNAANELATSQTSAGVTTNTYDASGNLLISLAPGNQVTTNTWDGENRMTQVELPVGVVDTFTYDGGGLRVQKEDSAGTTKHVWDNENILLETNVSNIVQVVYSLKPALYGNLISQSRSGVDSFYQFDVMGLTRQLTNSAGSIVDTYLYDSFGNIINGGTSGTTTNPFLYIGMKGYYMDSDLDSYYIRARIYASTTGRFIVRDPLSFDGENLYLYVGNQPVSAIDPSGRLKITPMSQALGEQPCGSAPFIIWKYSLSGKNTCSGSGYFVQKINYSCRSITCALKETENVQKTIYEAFESPAGASITDIASKGCVVSTFGTSQQIAHVRYYCQSEIGDLSKDPIWKLGAVFMSPAPHYCTFRSSLEGYATEAPVPFWNDPQKKFLEGGATRIFASSWDCCVIPCSNEAGNNCFGAGSPRKK